MEARHRFVVVLLAVVALLTTAPIARAVTHVCPAQGAKVARPIKMGVSVGVSDPYHAHCGAGTAGILVSNWTGTEECRRR